MKQSTILELSYLLSGPGRQPVIIDTLSEITAEQEDKQTWQAEFTLPSDAGLVEAETLSFTFFSQDDLDNTGDSILCVNAFQVYQGNLPPLAADAGGC